MPRPRKISREETRLTEAWSEWLALASRGLGRKKSELLRDALTSFFGSNDPDLLERQRNAVRWARRNPQPEIISEPETGTKNGTTSGITKKSQ
jgi:hypothetical protein